MDYTVTEKTSVFFHEDDYCQIEIIPEENFFVESKKIEEGKIKLEENGFLEIFARKPYLIKTVTRHIDIDSFENDAKQFAFKKFETINTGYSQTTISKSDTVAFGFENYVLFANYTSQQIVENIWVSYFPSIIAENVYPERLEMSLHLLGKKWGLILIDWNEELVVRLSSLPLIREYLKMI